MTARERKDEWYDIGEIQVWWFATSEEINKLKF